MFAYGLHTNVPDMVIKGNLKFRVITDQLGSVRLVVNMGNGSVARRIDYDDWGNVTQDTNPGFQPFGFAGGIYDRDTGFVRFGLRDYDPASGRWVSKDLARFEGGLNFYEYAQNDPVNLVDPTGFAPGDPYLTRDAAAMAAIGDVWFDSVTQNREFGGSIYAQPTPDGLRWSYTPGLPGDRGHAQPHNELLPEGATRAGGYHTHPNGRDKARHCSAADKLQASAAGIPEYLGGPNGDVRVFNPVPLSILGSYTPAEIEDDPRFADRKIGNVNHGIWWLPGR